MMKNKIKVNGKVKGMGYLKSLNTRQDFSVQSQQIKPLLQSLKLEKKLPTQIDFRSEMSHIRDQKELGSCTSFAASALVEYFEQKRYQRHIDISTLFTYKTTRNLMKVTGDTGAYLRTTMGSIALFGSPPEEYWEYDISKFDVEPKPFCYAFASNYQSLRYIRIDTPGIYDTMLLGQLKKFLANKVPIMFGFSCFDSLNQATTNGGKVPFPSQYENLIGGHAITMCGYDDDFTITNNTTGQTTTGAFIFKNSWGLEWGDKGYGYLPYEYFLQELADDCWTILSQEWIDHLQFQE